MTKSNGNTEIVVHVDEALDALARRSFVNNMNGHAGIGSAQFCPSRNHLLLVQYDRGQINSLDVLQLVKRQQVHAELVGPV